MKVVAATGQLGTGFSAETLARACEGADVVGCDAGSTDPGPYYLGAGKSQAGDAAVERDLEYIIEQAIEHDIPAIVGSAGTAGARPHLQRTVDVVKRIARRRGWRFTLATIDSEISHEEVTRARVGGKLHALAGAPALSKDTIAVASHFVAMQGVEPFQEALKRGAQILIAGRASDVSIYAAFPLLRGIPAEIAYHAGKILECGAAAVEVRLHPDSMVAYLGQDSFVVEPPNERMRCTPQSVAAHALYENADPFRHIEPAGILDVTHATYAAVSGRAVRVGGGRFFPAEQRTIRIEGAQPVGFRTVVVAGVRDPLVVRQIDDFLDKATKVIVTKVEQSLATAPDGYRLRWLVYGRDGSLGALEPERRVDGHEVGLVLDIVASTQVLASSIASVAWHTTLHHPISEYAGLVSNLAFPFSPPSIDVGEVYRFCINHAMEVDDPCDLADIQLEDIRARK